MFSWRPLHTWFYPFFLENKMKKVFPTVSLSFLRFLLVVCAVALLTSTGCRESAKPVLYFYTWADYIDPALVKDFERKHDCRVVFDYFESNEAMLAKFQSGKVGYDVILPSTYMIETMKKEGFLRQLDAKKIPNAIKYIDPVIARKLKDEKMTTSVPYLLSFSGVGYNVEKVGEAPTSWAIFGDDRFKGRMTMLDDIRETLGAALVHLGYSVNTTDQKELDEARDLVISWKKNLAKFGVDDAKQGLKSGEFYVVHAYSGDIMQMSEEDENIQFTTLEDGVLFAADHFVISKRAQNPDLAHAFINFMCDPKNSAKNMEYTQFMAPNPEALKKVSKELLENPGFAFTTEVIEKAEMIEDLGKDQTMYSKAWDEIKSAR